MEAKDFRYKILGRGKELVCQFHNGKRIPVEFMSVQGLPITGKLNDSQREGLLQIIRENYYVFKMWVDRQAEKGEDLELYGVRDTIQLNGDRRDILSLYFRVPKLNVAQEVLEYQADGGFFQFFHGKGIFSFPQGVVYRLEIAKLFDQVKRTRERAQRKRIAYRDNVKRKPKKEESKDGDN